MRIELKELQPLLKEKTEENSKMLINLQKKQKEANAQREVCESDERECNIKKE
jgi:dynein heavy chain